MSYVNKHKARWRQHKSTRQRKNPESTLNKAQIFEAVVMHWNQLKAIPNHDERNQVAVGVLNQYRDYLANWSKQNDYHQNPVLERCIIWSVNIHDWSYAIELVQLSILRRQQMTLIQRDAATFVADAILERAKTEPGYMQPYAEDVFERIKNGSWNVNSVVEAAYYRHMAVWLQESRPEIALRYAETAKKTHQRANVANLIKSLKKRLTEHTPQSSGDDDPQPSPSAQADDDSSTGSTVLNESGGHNDDD